MALDLSWSLEGDGRETVCLIHPLGMDRGFWSWLQTDLTGGFRWLGVDLPGHGRSPVPAGSYTVEDVAASIARLVGEQGLERVAVIGCSIGGMVALALAGHHPDQVDRIVLADSTARYAPDFGWETRAAAARTEGVAPLIEGTLERWFSAAALEEGSPAIDYVRDRLQMVNAESYALACEALGEADLTTVAGSVNTPALVIAGEDDVLVDGSRWLAAHLPQASLHLLAGAKHGAPLERRQDFAVAVGQFLAPA
jgi:3-oxoadipate enol-lactonase